MEEHERKLYLHPKAQEEVLDNGNVVIWLKDQIPVEFSHESFVDLLIVLDSVYEQSLIMWSSTWTKEYIDEILLTAGLNPSEVRKRGKEFTDELKNKLNNVKGA